jgi:hypothetical protein
MPELSYALSIHLLFIGNKTMKQVTTSALNNPMVVATQALVKGKVIGSEIVDLITKGTKKSLDTAKTKSKTVDLMQAQGLKSYDLDLSNKANVELHNQIKGAIVLGFDLDAQALLAKESKVLSDFEKATKRALGMQIGSEFAYYRRALAKREESAQRGEVEKSTPVEMYFKDLQSALDRLAKLEELDFDLVQHTSAIKKLLADK